MSDGAELFDVEGDANAWLLSQGAWYVGQNGAGQLVYKDELETTYVVQGASPTRAGATRVKKIPANCVC